MQAEAVQMHPSLITVVIAKRDYLLVGGKGLPEHKKSFVEN